MNKTKNSKRYFTNKRKLKLKNLFDLMLIKQDGSKAK